MAMMASYINEGKEKAKRYLNPIVPESVSEVGLTRKKHDVDFLCS